LRCHGAAPKHVGKSVERDAPFRVQRGLVDQTLVFLAARAGPADVIVGIDGAVAAQAQTVMLHVQPPSDQQADH